MKGAVVCATAYLLYLCASLTVWQQRAAGLVNELSVDKVGQQDKAVDELLVLVGSDKLNELTNPASPLRETFRQKQREIRAVHRSIQADSMTFERLNAYQSANVLLVAWFEDASQRVGSLFAGDTADAKETVFEADDGKLPPLPRSSHRRSRRASSQRPSLRPPAASPSMRSASCRSWTATRSTRSIDRQAAPHPERCPASRTPSAPS